MKRFLLLMFVFWTSFAGAEMKPDQQALLAMVDSNGIPDRVSSVSPGALVPGNEPSQFDLQMMPLSQVISLYFKEVSHQSYVLCDAVLNDQRVVSIRAFGTGLDTAIFRAVLDANGYEIRSLSGVATVCLKPVPVKVDANATTGEPFVYRPKYQDVRYLVDLLSPLVEGHFANRRQSGMSVRVGGGETETSNMATQAAEGDDLIVFSGKRSSIKRLQQLLQAVDVPSTSVVVRAVLYEVSRTSQDASALRLMADLFSGKVGVTVGRDQFSNSLSIKTGDFDFVASAISTDGRFKVVTAPFARVRSGERVRLQVGADVPVAGEFLVSNGQTTQSTEYHESGVILDVGARVRGGSIDVDLTQTVSSFVQTTTGNPNPTLNKREIKSSLSLTDGEVVVLGGVTDSKGENKSEGLFGWNFSDSENETESELVLMMQVKRV